MKTINWGIIGCGNVCEVKSGPAFYKCQNSALYAVMRRDAAKAEDFATRHGVPVWYTSAEDLINDPLVDVVYVATPPSTHAEYAMLAMKAGKPVYVEKPMAMNYEECLLMNQVATQTHQKLWVAYYRRSLPYFIKAKEIVESGILGKIQTVSVRFFRPPATYDLVPEQNIWRVDKKIAGGGYFYDLAPHTIDILCFILGNISDAKGVTGNVRGLYNVEDTVSASFTFESGVIGSGIWCFVSSPQMTTDLIEIAGEKGVIRFSTFSFSPIEIITDAGVETFNIPSPQHIQQPLIQSIVDEMLEMGKSPSTGESAAHTSWVIDRIFLMK